MTMFCNDRDLLAVEPVIFIGGGFVGQNLITSGDGVLNGTTFTSPGSDFISAGVEAGMVLCVYSANPAEGDGLEIVSVDSTSELTVSVLRGSADDEAIAPPAGTGLSFYVRTYAAQIANVSGTLSEKLRQILEVAGVCSGDFADSSQLKTVAAYGVLSSIFVARADNATAQDANWTKAEHYHKKFHEQQLQLRLAVDSDGDGVAEQTRTLGNVSLRRL